MSSVRFYSPLRRANSFSAPMSTGMPEASPFSEAQEPSLPGVQFEPLLSTAEAAALLQIHPKTLQKLARAGEVVGIRIGKLWRFRASALNGWLARMAGE